MALPVVTAKRGDRAAGSTVGVEASRNCLEGGSGGSGGRGGSGGSVGVTLAVPALLLRAGANWPPGMTMAGLGWGAMLTTRAWICKGAVAPGARGPRSPRAVVGAEVPGLGAAA